MGKISGTGLSARFVMGGGSGNVASSNSSFAKTIGTMNKSGNLVQSISYNEISHLLDAVGEEYANKLLQELSDKAHTIRNPTAWLKQAAERKQGGGADFVPREERGEGFGAMIRNLNQEGILQGPLQYRDVIGALASVGDSARTILEELRLRADEITNPTEWVIEEAVKAGGTPGPSPWSEAKGKGKGKDKGKGKGKGKGGFDGWGGFDDPWMMMMDWFGGDSWGFGDAFGGKGFGGFGKGFGKKGDGKKGKGKGPAYKGSGDRLDLSGKSVVDALDEVNSSGLLAQPLDYGQIQDALESVGDHGAVQLLEDLSEAAKTVKNPVAWLSTAAQRKSGGGRDRGAKGGKGWGW